MTNQAISVILDHLSNEARNSAHATFGAFELLQEGESNLARLCPSAIATASNERLLRSIDDVRELLAITPRSPAPLEQFDLTLCTAGIIETLNLVSHRRVKHMFLDAPTEPLMVMQERLAVEQVFTRLLETAFHLTSTSEVRVRLSANLDGKGGWLALAARDAELAQRLIKWLNGDPGQATLHDPDDVRFGIPTMLAGKHLRELGGSAEFERDSAGHFSVAVNLPSQLQAIEADGSENPDSVAQPDALNVLVVEDCDESYVLSEVLLQDERVSRARDGDEGLRLIRKQRFDLVLMDIHLPGMNGYQVIRSMRDWETETGNARTPIVVLSSDDLGTQQRSAAEYGCSGFLRKPLHRGELTNVLGRLRQARILVA
jgi:CheY-like chemotaxis protein